MVTKAVGTKATSTEEGVWRCSSGEEFEGMEALGGHFSRYQKDENHKSLGLGPLVQSCRRCS